MIPGNASPLLLASAAADAPAAADVATKSLRFNSGDSANLSTTFTNTEQKKYTVSFWVKRSTLGTSQRIYSTNTNSYIMFNTDDKLHGNSRGTGSTNAFWYSTRVFRDVGAWYHIVVAYDMSQSAFADKLKIYVNGELETLTGSLLNINQHSGGTHYIGTRAAATMYLDAYLADFYYIGGSQVNATSFGAFNSNGVWQAAEYSGTFGTNGFHLKFDDASSDSALGEDSSGNNNTWTVNNITAKSPGDYDSPKHFSVVAYTGDGGSSRSIDSLAFQPDLVWIKARNAAYSNHLYDSVRGVTKRLRSDQTAVESTKSGVTSFDSDGFTLGSDLNSNENNKTYVAWCWDAGDNSNKTYTVKVVSDSGNKYRFDDFGTSAVTLDLAEGSTYVFDQSDSSNSGHPLRFSTTSDGTHNSGTEYTTGVTTTGTPGSAGAKTTIVLPAPVTYSDGTQTNPDTTRPLSNLFDGSTSTLIAAASGNNSSSKVTLPVSVTAQTSVRFYSGAGGYDNGPVTLSNNGTTVSTIAAESSQASGWKSFTGTFPMTFNEFTVNRSATGTGSGAAAIEVDGQILLDDNSTPTLYYYCSSHSGMGGQANTNSTEGASNFDGSIQAKVKANQDYGFSVVSYTGNGTSGATVGHGLGSAPKMIIVKNRDLSPSNWQVYHSGPGATKYFSLNSTQAQADNAGAWNDTEPTSSVFSLGTFTYVNKSGDDLIAYCWSEISGFSKFNTYSGGTANQTISTGFKPAFLLIKRTDAANSWLMFDNARGVSNLLRAESSNAEFAASGGNDEIEFLADGFKLVSTNNGINGSGGTYIYMAFAGTPAGENDDSLFDVPTNGTQSDTGAGGEVSGNYCTLNPLHANQVLANVDISTLSNGNLTSSAASNGNKEASGTIGVSSGKWYFELTNNSGGANNDGVGICNLETGTEVIYRDGGSFRYDGSTTSSYGATWRSSGDIIGVAIDLDNTTIAFYKNGISQGNAKTDLPAGTYHPYVYNRAGVPSASELSVNFGQREFAFDAPSGYKALCTTNLPTPTIADGSDYFDTKLYTGNGSTQTISGLGFSPDWVWTKARSFAENNNVFDTVRGVTKLLLPDATTAEQTISGIHDALPINRKSVV